MALDSRNGHPSASESFLKIKRREITLLHSSAVHKSLDITTLQSHDHTIKSWAHYNVRTTLHQALAILALYNCSKVRGPYQNDRVRLEQAG